MRETRHKSKGNKQGKLRKGEQVGRASGDGLALEGLQTRLMCEVMRKRL